MNIDLKKWLEKLKMDKLRIDKTIEHIEALLGEFPNEQEFTCSQYKPSLSALAQELDRNSARKIHKGKEIRKVCENMSQEFTSSDIKYILEQSSNKEIREIKLAYISHLLGILAKNGKIRHLADKPKNGNANYYILNRGNNIEQIETEQKESP